MTAIYLLWTTPLIFPSSGNLVPWLGKLLPTTCNQYFPNTRWSDTLVTDNRPCYTSKEFQLLMQSMSVNNLTSSPHYLPEQWTCMEKFVENHRELYSTKPKKKANFHTHPLWSIEIHLSLELYSHQCRFYKVDKLILTYHCYMLPKCKWALNMHPNQLLKFFM